MQFTRKATIAFSITFAFVATHNHFVLDRGGKVFKRSAPIIKLPAEATEDDHLALLGLLNSSTACFWMKQVFHDKGSRAIGRGFQSTKRWEIVLRAHGNRSAVPFPIPEQKPLHFPACSTDSGATSATRSPTRS